MTLTQKESMLLEELKASEQLCTKKYAKYASEACDGKLKNLFTQIGQEEYEHADTITQIISGTIPQMGGKKAPEATDFKAECNEEAFTKDKFLCEDALTTEKGVSSLYNTCIFEFANTGIRDTLNHIQKEEQQHGERIYSYMSQNGMYN